MNRRQVLRLGGAALVATASAGCSSAGGSEDVKQISMTDNFGFDPKRLTINVGTTVKWTNESDVGHTVTAYDGQIPAESKYFASGEFDSEKAARNNVSEGLIASGEAYEHTFEVTGTYEYVCIPHESSGMTGTVVVK